MECHGDRLPRAVCKYGSQRHDVSYDEAREAASEDGDTDDVFPRQAAESNALLFSLVHPLAGYMVKSMRLLLGLRKSRIAATAATAAALT